MLSIQIDTKSFRISFTTSNCPPLQATQKGKNETFLVHLVTFSFGQQIYEGVELFYYCLISLMVCSQDCIPDEESFCKARGFYSSNPP